MGHIHLGYLPKTRRWNEVVGLLALSPEDVGAVAGATTRAAERRLRELANDPSLAYCFWILTRISSASRETDFQGALAELGIEARHDDSALSFIARLSDHIGDELSQHPESGPFSELASLAIRRALTETVGQQGRSLFGSSLEDLQAAFRRYSTPVRFGVLAKSYFGDLFARSLRFFVEKELANNTGAEHSLTSAGEALAFSEALDLYARQSARIMERFGQDWYSRRTWQSEGRIGRDEAHGFTAYALKKLRSELTRPRA